MFAHTCLLYIFEETFHTHYTDKILGCGDQVNVRDIKKEVYKIDRQIVLEKCGTADCTPAAVTIEERIGWIPLWEMALDCVREDPVATG